MVINNPSNFKCNEPKFELIKKAILTKGELDIKIISDSMSPVIKIGDIAKVISIKNYKPELKTFDIILYWNGSLLICHYVWNLNQIINNNDGRNITTRSIKESGNNGVPISFDHILGKIIDHQIPLWRKIVIILKNYINQTL